jgi:hypothetical protein
MEHKIKRPQGMHFHPPRDGQIEPGSCQIAMGQPPELRNLQPMTHSRP